MFIKLEIVDWHSYCTRRDYKHPWWFAFPNKFLEDPQVYDFSDQEKLAWIYILCQASQANSESVNINVRHAERACGVKPKNLRSAIKRMIELGKLKSVHSPDDICTNFVQHKTEQKNTEQENITSQPEGFDQFFSVYPVKVSKTKASKIFGRLTRQGVSLDKILAALSNYRKYCERQGTPEKFIKHPDKFLVEYSDWLAPDVGSCDLKESTSAVIESWEAKAAKVFEGISRFGPDEQNNLRQFLGEDLFSVCVRITGGFLAVRQMPNNQFRVRTLAGMLREAARDL